MADEKKKKKQAEEERPDPEGLGLNGFMNFLNKVAQLFYINICWLIACIPVITIGPASIALYSTIEKCLINNRGYAISGFWKEVKANFKSGIKVWIPMFLAMLVMGFDISYFYNTVKEGHAWGLVYLVFLVILVLTLLTALYSFAYMAKFTDTTIRCIRNPLFLMLMHPFRNVLIVIMGIILILFAAFVPWTLLILPSAFMMMFVNYMEKIFMKMINEQNGRQEENEEQEEKAGVAG